jgi:hypothetical protein
MSSFENVDNHLNHFQRRSGSDRRDVQILQLESDDPGRPMTPTSSRQGVQILELGYKDSNNSSRDGERRSGGNQFHVLELENGDVIRTGGGGDSRNMQVMRLEDDGRGETVRMEGEAEILQLEAGGSEDDDEDNNDILAASAFEDLRTHARNDPAIALQKEQQQHQQQHQQQMLQQQMQQQQLQQQQFNQYLDPSSATEQMYLQQQQLQQQQMVAAAAAAAAIDAKQKYEEAAAAAAAAAELAKEQHRVAAEMISKATPANLMRPENAAQTDPPMPTNNEDTPTNVAENPFRFQQAVLAAKAAAAQAAAAEAKASEAAEAETVAARISANAEAIAIAAASSPNASIGLYSQLSEASMSEEKDVQTDLSTIGKVNRKSQTIFHLDDSDSDDDPDLANQSLNQSMMQSSAGAGQLGYSKSFQVH